MPIKKTPKSKKPKPPFLPMKPKKGFAAVQIVVAVAPDGSFGTSVFDDMPANEAIEDARERIHNDDYGYEERHLCFNLWDTHCQCCP